MEDGREEAVTKVTSAWCQNDTMAMLGTNCTFHESRTQSDSNRRGLFCGHLTMDPIQEDYPESTNIPLEKKTIRSSGAEGGLRNNS